MHAKFYLRYGRADFTSDKFFASPRRLMVEQDTSYSVDAMLIPEIPKYVMPG
nr:hypothetical protein 1 [Paracoccaceae bacterium]